VDTPSGDDELCGSGSGDDRLVVPCTGRVCVSVQLSWVGGTQGEDVHHLERPATPMPAQSAQCVALYCPAMSLSQYSD